MIARISPLLRLPSSVDAFDYLVPEEMEKKIKIGQLATIPWRLDKITGVVLSLGKQGEPKRFRARPVAEILDEKPILTSAQIKLIKKFSGYYFSTQGYAARLMAPEPLKIASSSGKSAKFSGLSEFYVSKSQISELKKSIRNFTQSAAHIKIQDVSSFVWLIMHLAKNTKKQVLALFPTIDLINEIGWVVQKMCSSNFRKFGVQTAVIHSELSKGAYFQEYEKVISGKAKIILSTRQGVFLPICDKSMIVFFEYSSQDFKQYDQHPRYDARAVAEWVSNITDSRLIFTSASPSLIHNCSWPVKESIELPYSSIDINTAVALVDMNQEMLKKDFSVIADSTLEQIKKTIAQNKKVLIISLRQEAQTGVSVEKIFRVLTQDLKNCRIAKNWPADMSFDILVTTPYPLEALKLSLERNNFGLAVFSSIEPLLGLQDFRASERVFNRLNFWKMMCQELQIPRIILQSYSPDNLAVRAFAYGEADAFKKSELENRKSLLYPPFSQLIKLWYAGDCADTFKTTLKLLSDKLKTTNNRANDRGHQDKPCAYILGPFKDKKQRQSILLKITKYVDLSVLRCLPDGWVIDRDPENVL